LAGDTAHTARFGGKRGAANGGGHPSPPAAVPRWSRVRLVSYVILAALAPLVLAGWAFAQLAAGTEVEKADAILDASLRASTREFGRVLADANNQALALARDPATRRAVVASDRSSLARAAARAPNVLFLSRAGTPLAGTPSRGAVRRDVEVIAAGRTAGWVVVLVPLDKQLLERLERAGDPRVAAALTVGDSVVESSADVGARLDVSPGTPSDIATGEERYRAHAARLVSEPQPVTLVALRSRSSIDDAVRDVRREIFLAGVVALAGVALVAYALSPTITRGRLALAERTQAARVLSHVADGVFVVDPRGVVTAWNSSAEAITGLRADRVRGRRTEDAIPSWGDVALLIPIASTPAERVRPQTVPLTIDDRELWISASGVRFSEGTVYAFRDLTEERRVEELRNDFLATVSHELRTPLTSVLGAATTLRAGRASTPQLRDQLLAIIADQTDRLARIVDEILLASQLSSGSLSLAQDQFDPVALADATVEAERARLPERLALDLVAADEVPPAAGDSEKARQVLEDLIDNAVKYSPGGGRIEVAVDRNDGSVRFTVRDEGVGIPLGEQERIFEKFYRLDPDQTGGVGGTGLGLYICRELVRRMNGRMSVDSEPGVGSTFTFELPVAPPPVS
jgi:PAS domain S-box-containing protein